MNTETQSLPLQGVGMTTFENLEPGIYQAEITDIAVVPSEQYGGTQFKFQFDLLDEEGNPHSHTDWATCKLSGGARPSKLYTWVSALEGTLPPTYFFEPSEWIGRKFRVVMENVTKDDGTKRDRIKTWMPLSKAQKAKLAQPPEPRPAAL